VSCASSPCIGVCKLDENKVCIGCFRTIEEIRQKGLERIPIKKEEFCSNGFSLPLEDPKEDL
jgi:hypothetical protein